MPVPALLPCCRNDLLVRILGDAQEVGREQRREIKSLHDEDELAEAQPGEESPELLSSYSR